MTSWRHIMTSLWHSNLYRANAHIYRQYYTRLHIMNSKCVAINIYIFYSFCLELISIDNITHISSYLPDIGCYVMMTWRNEVRCSCYLSRKYSNELVIIENHRNGYNIADICGYLPDIGWYVMMTSCRDAMTLGRSRYLFTLPCRASVV